MMGYGFILGGINKGGVVTSINK